MNSAQQKLGNASEASEKHRSEKLLSLLLLPFADVCGILRDSAPSSGRRRGPTDLERLVPVIRGTAGSLPRPGRCGSTPGCAAQSRIPGAESARRRPSDGKPLDDLRRCGPGRWQDSSGAVPGHTTARCGTVFQGGIVRVERASRRSRAYTAAAAHRLAPIAPAESRGLPLVRTPDGGPAAFAIAFGEKRADGRGRSRARPGRQHRSAKVNAV